MVKALCNSISADHIRGAQSWTVTICWHVATSPQLFAALQVILLCPRGKLWENILPEAWISVEPLFPKSIVCRKLKEGLLQEELAVIFAAMGAAVQLLSGKQVGKSLQLLKTMLWATSWGAVDAVVRSTAITRVGARIENGLIL